MNKERNSVDDFFRESLQNHKVPPSDTARSRFLDAVAPNGSTGENNTLRWFIIAGVTVVITATVLLYSMFAPNNSPAPTHIEVKTTIEKSPASVPEIKPINTENSIQPSPASSNVVQPATNTFKSDSDLNHSKSASLEISNTKTGELKNKSAVYDQIVLNANVTNEGITDRIAVPSLIAETELPESKLIIADAESKTQIIVANIDSTVETVNQGNDIPPSSDPTLQPHTQSGVSAFSFSPFLVYSLDLKTADNQNQFMHSLSLEGEIKYRRFTFHAGAGLTAVNGSDRYEVEYNDYLGEYNKLDSISFTWDEKHYNLVPAYHMSETKVWDSALKLDSYYVQKSYNHLRIPVMFGYEILNKGKFVIGVNSGLEMLLFLHSRNRSNQEYAIGLNKLVNIKPVSGELTRSTFWLMANLSVAYQFSRRISLVVEPQLHYLLNPAGTASGHPESKAIPVLRTSLKIKL